MKIGTIAIVGLLLVGAGCAKTDTAAKPQGVPHSEAAATADARVARTLDLSGKGLDEVPMSVFEKDDLKELNVSNNHLTGALPSQIQNLQKLRVLNASKNEMTGVPAEIGQLSALQVLDLHENKLTGLPMELANLANLRILDLRGNRIAQQDLAEIRLKLPSLQILQ